MGEHLKRLAGSLRGIGKPLAVPAVELEGWVENSLKESRFSEALLRLSVHPTPSPLGGQGFTFDKVNFVNFERTHFVKCKALTPKSDGLVVLVVREFKPYPEEFYEKGVALKTAVSRRWTLKAQDSQVKASQYVSGVTAFLDNGRSGAHEFIFLGEGGVVAEGTVSNIFIVKEKRLLTPHAASGILRGVTRGLAMDLARKRGLKVSETLITRHEIYSADECFITNTSLEILPVAAMDQRRIGAGGPGPVTRTLAKDFKKYVRVSLRGVTK